MFSNPSCDDVDYNLGVGFDDDGGGGESGWLESPAHVRSVDNWRAVFLARNCSYSLKKMWQCSVALCIVVLAPCKGFSLRSTWLLVSIQ
jgi:hypothetical protein